jgi:hypothetical protein
MDGELWSILGSGRNQKLALPVFGKAMDHLTYGKRSGGKCSARDIGAAHFGECEEGLDSFDGRIEVLPKLARHGYKHGAVSHAAEEWVNGIHHVQGIEGFCSIVKRSIRGTHMHVSRRHVAKYLAEFELAARPRCDVFSSSSKTPRDIVSRSRSNRVRSAFDGCSFAN